MSTRGEETTVESVDVGVYTIPTDGPEADGTLAWTATSVVVVEVHTHGGISGLGYTFADTATGTLVRDLLAGVVTGSDVRESASNWEAMVRAIRNLGRPGICSMAIAAIDIALWDAKARYAETPLFRLLGNVRDAVPVYGSGGFTTYSVERLVGQLGGWVADGIPRVKMKIGRERGGAEADDLARVAAVREAIGDGAELFVDANGAYDRTQARRLGVRFFEEHGVSWFEEPVSSDDLHGLAGLREALSLEVTAGEYGYDVCYFERMLDAGAVDVIQADVGRCAGITEWLRVAAVAAAHETPLSAHCGPALHAHVACVPPNLRHIEYFHDHVRIDAMLFDGVLTPIAGSLRPASDRPGMGLTLRRGDVERYRVA